MMDRDFLPITGAADADGDIVARAGQPIDPATTRVASQEAVIDALRTVHDPEIPVNIFELGLIYDLAIAADGTVAIEMTLTAPACPVAGILPGQVAEAVAAVEGVGEVAVTLVWDPPWDMTKMSEDARMALGFG
jgi:FeS assembly SUF system protein